MWTLEVFKARAFRLALGFALTISVAMAAAFAFIYLQVSRADMDQVGAVLVDEAAKSVDESEADLRRALELRLTRDVRRLRLPGPVRRQRRKNIQPRDQIEAMLATQMAAVHMASMTFARRLAHVENIPQQDGAERAFNKLIRTFAAQVSALKEYRTKGEQKMTVQHVHVAERGQAIVGNVRSEERRVGKECLE